MKDEMSEKFSDVSLKVDSLNENITVSDTGGQEKFRRVEENFNALQTALRDIQSDNSTKIQKVRPWYVEDTDNYYGEGGGGLREIQGPADLAGDQGQGEQGADKW